MKRTILSTALALALTTSMANANPEMEKDSDWDGYAKDAWIDGKAEATLLFNGNLDSFDINTDVKDGVVILTGKVDNEVDKELASELLLGIDGVKSVENQLTVMNEDEEDSDVMSGFTDAKIATVIKSRLLFDSEVSGTDIDVSVEDQIVMLRGTVDSDAAKDLAMTIAQNTDDVKDVKSEISVKSKMN
uniref:BON domain-containing protein n=1 Tax=Ningiella ruwaisensis TaxID=2364274 RepID=UPI0010A04600|nr:BON domain-containing protein [Ningiella ruwaisensis]